MASICHLYSELVRINDDIVLQYENSSNQWKNINVAAIRIQKLFRGYMTRKTLRSWNAAAIIIQKTFRGWRIRYQLPGVFHEYFDRICLEKYTNAASKIQALWKGYKTRKYEVCIPEIMRNKKESVESNLQMRQILAEFHNRDRQSCENECREVLNVLFDRHHLLRTFQKASIFSSNEGNDLSQTEKLLNELPWLKYMKKLRKVHNKLCESENKKADDKKYVQMDKNCPNKSFKKIEAIFHKKMSSKYLQTTFNRKRTCKKPIDRQCFNLDVHHYTKLNEKNVYHLDFWYKYCKLHNL